MALAILYLFKQGTQRGEFNGVKFQVCKGALNEGKNEYYATHLLSNMYEDLRRRKGNKSLQK